MNNTQKSLAAILICYFSWGLFPIYFKLLKSIGAYEVLAMRILCSFIFMILVVGVAKNKKIIFEEIKKIWGNKKKFSPTCSSFIFNNRKLVNIYNRGKY